MSVLFHSKPYLKSGFSLVQMSIVLVVIGLIIGGTLMGQNLIDAAKASAQISQIQNYQTAVTLFETKYNGYLPGDLPDPYASNFGFQARGQYDGQGDGNGALQGNCGNVQGGSSGAKAGCGESAVFWQDLSTVGFIDSNIQLPPNCKNITTGGVANLNTQAKIAKCYPVAKLGNNAFVYTYSLKGTNYYAISTATLVGSSIESTLDPGLTVQQAYNVDSKVDDGLPQSGIIQACYINYYVVNLEPVWAAGGGGTIQGASGGANCKATTTATSPLPTDCYGNNNTAGMMTYSVSTNANLQNCALSFQFQN